MDGQSQLHAAAQGFGATATGPKALPQEARVPFASVEISQEARFEALKVLESGWVTLGPETKEFEQDFADYVDAEHAIAVSSCTIAIELALRSLRLPAGSAVLVPTLTFCGAAHAILHAGLTPMLVDVDPATAMPSPETIKQAIATHGRPAAMLALHFAGAPAPLREMASAAELPLDRVVEDAAHALGTHVHDRAVGSISRATCFSFYATKNLPIGEGGMITTDDSELASWLRRTRLHGMSVDAWRRHLPGGHWRYTVEEAGLKANMTDLQAAIGRAQLRMLPGWQRKREAVASRYTSRLHHMTGLQLPVVPSHGRHAWHLYVVQVLPGYGTARDDLIQHLSDRGIDTSVHFIPLHHMPFFQRTTLLPFSGFPGADALFSGLLSLPIYPGLTDHQLDRVCDTLADKAPKPAHPAETDGALL